MTCDESCEKYSIACDNRECRNFMEYEDDLNCVLICAKKNGPLTLEQVSKRLGVSYVRIKQIEQRALGKMKITINSEEQVI